MANAYSHNMNGFIDLKYEKNAALHLVLGLFTTYIIIQSLYVIILVTSASQHNVFNGVMLPNLAIQPWADFTFRPWTILTYALTHASFFEMLTNLFWLYIFGNVIQAQIGYRNVIPLYALATLLAGGVYILATYFFHKIPGSYYILGFYAGNVAFAVAAIVINPGYNIPFTRTFKVPSWVPFIIFLILMTIRFLPEEDYAMLVLCTAGGAVGALYGILVKNGFDIGRKIYNIWDKTHDNFTPTSEVEAEAILNDIDDATIAAINKKIDEEGINYLSTKEIEILNRWRNK